MSSENVLHCHLALFFWAFEKLKVTISLLCLHRPKLWKHHGASSQAKEIQLAATEQKCDWLKNRYPAGIDCEWLHPKALEVYDEAPNIFETAACFAEAGDWLVWKLTAGSHNIGETLVRLVGLWLC